MTITVGKADGPYVKIVVVMRFVALYNCWILQTYYKKSRWRPVKNPGSAGFFRSDSGGVSSMVPRGRPKMSGNGRGGVFLRGIENQVIAKNLSKSRKKLAELFGGEWKSPYLCTRF